MICVETKVFHDVICVAGSQRREPLLETESAPPASSEAGRTDAGGWQPPCTSGVLTESRRTIFARDISHGPAGAGRDHQLSSGVTSRAGEVPILRIGLFHSRWLTALHAMLLPATLAPQDATEVSSVFEAGGVLALDDDPLLDFFDLGDTSTEQTSASLSGGSSCSIMSDEPEAPKEDSRKRKEA